MKNYIVFDLEWNQSAEGKENSIEHLPFEIIEIGGVKMDEEFRMVSEFHELITPQVYTQMHYKILEVTHMDMGRLKQEGRPFDKVIEEFLRWCGEDCIFCTWGAMDLTELQRNMGYYQVEIPFAKPLLYYDVQKLYALQNGDGKIKPSLDHAVEELGILEQRPFHQALDDAYYTGKVMQHLDFSRWRPYISIDYYQIPQNKEEEIYLEFPTYSKYVSRGFESKEEALADKTVTDMVCKDCKRMLRKKQRWFSLNQKQYFCLAICPVHGFVQGKIRMKKSEQGRFYVVKTIKPIDEAGAENVFHKKEEQRQKRRERGSMKKIKKSSLACRRKNSRSG